MISACLGRLALVALGGLGACSQGSPSELPEVPVVSLATPNAEHPHGFTSLWTARELSTGVLLVGDPSEPALMAADFGNGSLTPVGRKGPGPTEYRVVKDLFALAADTTLLYDSLGERILFVDPTGKIVASLPFPARGSSRLIVRADHNTVESDRSGNLFFQPFAPEAASGATADLIGAPRPILRLARNNSALDTIAHVQPRRVTVAGSGMDSFTMSIPFVAFDAWAVAPDGAVAVVRGDDYHVERIEPNGARTVGSAIHFQPIPVTEAEKRAYIRTMDFGFVGSDVTSRNSTFPWPETKAPVLRASIAPSGELWVARSRTYDDSVATYDVFDDRANLVRRVRLPRATRLLTLGVRAIYLIRTDADDLMYIQRYPLPGSAVP